MKNSNSLQKRFLIKMKKFAIRNVTGIEEMINISCDAEGTSSRIPIEFTKSRKKIVKYLRVLTFS